MVEHPLMAPNGLSTVGSIYFHRVSHTNLSRILERTGVKAIGRISFLIQSRLATFGNGITSADFQTEGKELWLMLELNIVPIGAISIPAKSRSTQFGMASGPTALTL